MATNDQRLIEELSDLVQTWKPILGLQDWDIHVELSNKIDDGLEGMVEYEFSRSTAIIFILHPKTYLKRNFVCKQSFEDTIVHEMLHILFSLIEPQNDTLASSLHERAIDKITRALVSLRSAASAAGVPTVGTAFGEGGTSLTAARKKKGK